MIYLSVLHDLPKKKHMNKALIIAKREYRAAVRTKGFLIALILLPVFMGGGLLVFTLLKDRTDVSDKRIVILDHSNIFRDYLQEAAENRNKNEVFNNKGEKILPTLFLEFIPPDTTNRINQKLELSEHVRNKEIHSFVEIGSEVIHPQPGQEKSQIFYFAENAALDNLRGWFNNIINNKIREVRILELGIDPAKVKDLFYWINVEGMSLLNIDGRTGEIREARKSNEMQTILVPYILLLLMFMMVMMAAVPLLSAVMEEKSERIAEVLLGSVTPWQFMLGKIIGSLGVSLTTSAIYIIGAVFTLNRMNLSYVIPYQVIPWFFIYMLLNITMIGSIMAALGATCNDAKDAQALTFPAMFPIIIPLFMMMPVIINPLGKMATILSLFPLWTPMLMLLRQSTSVTIPLWEIITGLLGVVLFTIFCVWAGARIFRSTIILQGKRPGFGKLFRYIIKG
jgi:ABC-2 type transport system permease protein